MNGLRRSGIASIVLASVLALLLLLPDSGTDTASLVGLTDEALKEKQRLLDGMAGGQILNLREEHYTKSRSQTLSPDPDSISSLPEHIRAEMWMAADEDGQITTYTWVGRSLEGELLMHSTLENGHTVIRNLATGEQESLPARSDLRIESWLEGKWSLSRRLSDMGFEFVGSGWVDGLRTAIFEQELEHTADLNRPADQRDRLQIPSYQWRTTRTVVQRLEIPLDRPILYRTTQWEMDETGERSLTLDFRAVEYRLLPADTQIGPFTTGDGS